MGSVGRETVDMSITSISRHIVGIASSIIIIR